MSAGMTAAERIAGGWRVVGIHYRRNIDDGWAHTYQSPKAAKELGWGPYTKVTVWSRKKR